METNYIDVLIQWLMLFALVSIVIVPALMFRKIALRLNKKGWVYFLLGAGVGLVTLQAARLLTFLLLEYRIIESKESYMTALMLFLVFPGVMVTMAIIAFSRTIARN